MSLCFSGVGSWSICDVCGVGEVFLWVFCEVFLWGGWGTGTHYYCLCHIFFYSFVFVIVLSLSSRISLLFFPFSSSSSVFPSSFFSPALHFTLMRPFTPQAITIGSTRSLHLFSWCTPPCGEFYWVLPRRFQGMPKQ